MMRNDQLALLQEFVGNAHAFAQQSAGILAQVQNQPFQIAELVERIGDFVLGGLLEAGNVDVANAGLDQECEVDAVARNLVAHQTEFHRLLDALAQDRDVNRRSLRPLKQVRNVGGAHVVGGLAVDGDDHVARDGCRPCRRAFRRTGR